MEFFRQPIMEKVLIIIGLLIFVTGAYLTDGLFPFKFKTVAENSFSDWRLFAVFRDAGAGLAVATIIITGINSIKIKTRKHWRKLMLFLGYGICMIFLLLNYVAYDQMKEILKSHDFRDMIATFENLLKQDNIPVSIRPILLRKLAEIRYLQSGEFIEITDKDNQRKIYEPLIETKRFKQQNDQSRKLFGWIKKQAVYSLLLWMGILIFSTLIGFIVPLRKNQLKKEDG